MSFGNNLYIYDQILPNKNYSKAGVEGSAIDVNNLRRRLDPVTLDNICSKHNLSKKENQIMYMGVY